jgi:hypothetical protein
MGNTKLQNVITEVVGDMLSLGVGLVIAAMVKMMF